MSHNKVYVPAHFITFIVLIIHIFFDASFSDKLYKMSTENSLKIQDVQVDLNILEQKVAEPKLVQRDYEDEQFLCLIKTNKKGDILSSSGAVERITGFASKEFENENISVIMPENLRTEHKNRIFQMVEDSEQKILFCNKLVEIVMKSGKSKKIRLSVSMFNSILTEEHEYIVVLKETKNEPELQ